MLFGLANSLRSLTRSPIAGALHEARRMARRPLEKGGTVPAHGDTDDAAGDFVVPSDVDPRLLATAIDAKLNGGRMQSRWKHHAVDTAVRNPVDVAGKTGGTGRDKVAERERDRGEAAISQRDEISGSDCAGDYEKKAVDASVIRPGKQ